jgi:hypothetical protein
MVEAGDATDDAKTTRCHDRPQSCAEPWNSAGDMSLVADDLAAGRLVQPFDLAINGPSLFAYFLVTPLEPATNSLVPSLREWVLREAEATKLNELGGRAEVPSRRRALALMPALGREANNWVSRRRF